MLVAVGNIRTQVLDATAQERKYLERMLAVAVPRHEYMPSFKSGLWDGQKHFYSIDSDTFPSGFLSIVVGLFQKRNWKIEVADRRTGIKDEYISVSQDVSRKGHFLRYDQIEAAEKHLNNRIVGVS